MKKNNNLAGRPNQKNKDYPTIIIATIFSAPIVLENNIITTAIVNVAIQISGLHFKTLIPSKLKIGNKLNVAKKLLTEKSYSTSQIY